MEPESHRVTSADGTTCELIVQHADAADAPTVLCLPAMGIAAAYYTPFLQELASTGCTAAAVDLRGVGSSSVRASRRTTFGYTEMVEQDIPAALEALQAIRPSKPIYLLGHSLGGQLGLLHASRRPSSVRGLALVATAAPYFRGWSGVRALGIPSGTHFALLVATAWGHLPGKTLGFGGREARGVIRDWARTSRTGRYELSDSTFEYERALSELSVPVLSITLHGDQLAPRRAAEHLLSKLSTASPVNRWHYVPDDRQPVDHNRWPRASRCIAERVSGWLFAQRTEGAEAAWQEQPTRPMSR